MGVGGLYGWYSNCFWVGVVGWFYDVDVGVLVGLCCDGGGVFVGSEGGVVFEWLFFLFVCVVDCVLWCVLFYWYGDVDGFGLGGVGDWVW